LELLASHGWDVRVFCGPTLDFERRESLAQLLSDQGIAFEERTCREGRIDALAGRNACPPFSLFHFRQNGVPVSVFAPAGPNRSVPSPDEGAAFLAIFERMLDEYRPDILLTYGGHWAASGLMARARGRKIAVVFALHNFEYRDARLFEHANAVLVPSQLCAEHYRRTLGLRCTAIPSPLNWSRVRCERSDAKQYVTFVNPQPNKGVFVFVRIAHELGRRRPDIPLLIVEGRGGVNWLARTGLDLSGLENMNAMANTPDPRDFYRVSRVVLMPSLWRESFGRVAAEALLNGIPVLASRRGALPEVLRHAGFLFDIPECYTPESRIVASAEEVAPWVETVIRLWDDAAFYEQESRRSLAAAEAWRPERLVAQYDAFFRGLLGS
jgi:glycosyltransferase involved in cell wall biosynthesis